MFKAGNGPGNQVRLGGGGGGGGGVWIWLGQLRLACPRAVLRSLYSKCVAPSPDQIPPSFMCEY